MKVPYSRLYDINSKIENEFFNDLKEIYANSSFVGGKYLDLFEENYSKYTGNEYTIGTSSGTDSLSIILRSLDLDPADGVIYYPANTFIGSILGALQMGFKCRPYDISLETLNAEYESISQIGDDASAVIAVHLYGYGLRSIKKFQEFCQSKNIPLIEDCSQAHFQKYAEGKQVSNYSTASFFSMFPGKNFGAIGQAGVICTSSKELSEKMKAIRNYGAPKKYEHSYKGFNYRLDSIQAAFLNRKLLVMEEEVKKRREIAKKYFDSIKNNNLEFLKISAEESVWHIFPVMCDKRDELIAHLSAKNIETVIHYPKNIHEFSSWNGSILIGKTENADLASRRILSIPCHGGMTVDEVNYVIKALNEFK